MNERPSSGSGSRARLEHTPEPVAVGAGTALFIDGRLGVGAEGGAPTEVELLAGGRPVELLGWGAPPPRSISGNDYWWTILPIASVDGPRELELGLRLDGGRVEALEALPLLPERGIPAERAAADEASRAARAEGEPLVAICMATYEPDPELLERQLDSIRAQSHPSWICLISDDGSSPAALETIRGQVGDDPRFVLSPAERNAGFYRNFERALELVPEDVDLVALSDQDDEWRPDKLARLIAGLDPGSQLVYSDMRIVDEQRRVLSETYWSFRRNNFTDFGSLMLANSVTGAASLFRRSLLATILPFPPRHAAAYHDHWIAQAAMALGPLSYVDAPLYDYTQHGDAAIGYLSANGDGRYSAPPLQRAQITWRRFRGRRYRLGWRQPYFNVYCRIALAAQVLLSRCGDRLAPGRAAVLERLVDPSLAGRWVLRRALEDGLGTDETLGRERLITAGLAWSAFQRTRRRVRG